MQEGGIVDFYANRLNDFASAFLSRVLDKKRTDYYMRKYVSVDVVLTYTLVICIKRKT